MTTTIRFECLATGAGGTMHFRVPVSTQEILYVAEWFSRLNDDHVVVARHAVLGTDVATAGFGYSTLH